MQRRIGIGLAACCLAATAAAEPSFLRAGDRWLFLGDSITHYDVYRAAVERVARHFHPEADLAFWNSAVPGVASGHTTEAGTNRPTLVSIMLGMNNTINSSWRYGQPFDVATYTRGIAASVRQWKQAGATVILLTPTLTDENQDSGFFELRGTADYLRELGRACYAIGTEEGCLVAPVQEEFEAFQRSLAAEQTLRMDGVHPSALGEYQIARTLWRRLNLPGPLDGKGDRRFSEPPPTLDVTLTAVRRFLTPDAPLPAFRLTAPQPLTVRVTWSLGKARGADSLQVSTNGVDWSPAIPRDVLPAASGDRAQMVVDLRADGRLSLCLVDLLRTRVAHLKDGRAGGEIRTDKERAEGKLVGTWQVELVDKALLLSGEVTDSSICPLNFWPCGRDGVNVWLDLRPTPRFADVGVDADVFQTILAVRDQPRFGCTLVPWLGRGMHLAADSGGEKTPTGYRWWMWVGGKLSGRKPLDFSEREFVGLNLWICDNDETDRGPQAQYFPMIHPDLAADHYPNSFLVLDLKGALPFDEVTNVHVFGP
jgi:hypothetical protein